jgi:hypothetical protein
VAISAVTPQWLEQVTSAYSQDPQALDLLTKLPVAGHSIPNYSLVNSLIKFNNKVWLGSNKDMQQQVIQGLHSNPIGGHSGLIAKLSKCSTGQI